MTSAVCHIMLVILSLFTEQTSVIFCLRQILEEGPAQEMMSEALLSDGRVDHVTMAMGLHSSYLACFLRTQHALLQLDGPLPLSWRHFIIILVGLAYLFGSFIKAASHSCVCL